MKTLFAIVVLCLLVSFVFAGNVQEYPVRNFSGGLVNSVANTLMKDNQALVLDNFDIDEYGNLKRRKGRIPHYLDNYVTLPGQAVIPFTGDPDLRGILVVRKDSARHVAAEPLANLGMLYISDDDNGVCTTFVAEDFYLNRRHIGNPYNIASNIVNKNLVVASYGNEMIIYDGNQRHMARPYGPGQPRVHTLDGLGNITGMVRYRYIYSNSGCPVASIPSFPIFTQSAKVFVDGLMPSLVGDSIYVYRQDDLKGRYKLVAALYGDTTFVDTVSNAVLAASSDLLPIEYYPTDYPLGGNDINHDSCGPGGLNVTIDSATGGNVFCIVNDKYTTCPYDGGLRIPPNVFFDSCTQKVVLSGSKFYNAWAIVFLDSSGNTSYMSPPAIKRIANQNATYRTTWDTTLYYATISNIPVPSKIDSASIVDKLLLRATFEYSQRFAYFPQQPADSQGRSYDYFEGKLGAFYIVDTLSPYTTSYVDSTLTFTELATDPRFYCRLDSTRIVDSLPDTCGTDSYFQYYVFAILDDTLVNSIIGYCRDDSTITFQPSDIAYFGRRLFAIGNPVMKNSVYFSDFGKPTHFAADAFIDIPSVSGDWANGIISMDDWLAVFRQNSIVGWQGLTFYQYKISEMANGIGLTAPQSLVRINNRAFFAHTTGVYAFPGRDWQKSTSRYIKNTIDSTVSYLNSAWAGNIDGEYWLSLPVGDSVNNKTYIYNEKYDYWRCYDFGIISGTEYDYESEELDYKTGRYVLLCDNDSLYAWGYADTTLDGSDTIKATYQSKYFFDNGEAREKYFGVTIYGTGSVDSLTVSAYGNYGADTVTAVTRAVDFSDPEMGVFPFDYIGKNLSIKISDQGAGDYTITGYSIWYEPTDRGKKP